MKLILQVFLVLMCGTIFGQCTLNDATGCACKTGGNDCDLLPDITVSWFAIEDYMGGPNEFSQTGNGLNNGRLKITASTPNIGHGPLTVRGTNYFVCNGDTVLGDPGVCPDGSSPRQLIQQRIYHKNSDGTMTYSDHYAGAMTFHPTHNHNHVDDWGVFTLRLEDVNEPDPRKWPIVGQGAKLGFCLMDYGTCSSYLDHCKDTNTTYMFGNTMINGDFPNWGLGGGNYNCSVVEQGISVGWTDIYSENLDGMWIDIPNGTCNGDYYIVAEIDPLNHFQEEDTSNNYTAVPITLTLQDVPGNPNFLITSNQGTEICDGVVAQLSAPAGFNYVWNTGDTTQHITTDTAGTYTVSLSNHCGSGTSAPFNISVLAAPGSTVISGDSLVCEGQSTNLNATGTNIQWYDDNGFMVGTGNTFVSPSLTADRTYFAEDVNIYPGTQNQVGLVDTIGTGGGYFNGSQSMLFDVLTPLKIKSFKVYANGAGSRDIQLQDNGGNIVHGGTYNLPNGESVVQVNYDMTVGTNYRLTVSSASPNLFRSNSNINYPYEIPDTLIIQTTTGGPSFYYYFYDWQIEVGSRTCAGPMSSYFVDVEDCTNIISPESSAFTVNVFPNPSKGQFDLELSGSLSNHFDIKILDILGKNIFEIHNNSANNAVKKSFDLSEMGPGIYLVEVRSGDSIVTKKIILE